MGNRVVEDRDSIKHLEVFIIVGGDTIKKCKEFINKGCAR
jgi:hypothetical protein